MEKNEINAATSNHQVELVLLGIDKIWVRSPKGEWVDKASLNKVTEVGDAHHEIKEIPGEKLAWWKFWKK